MTPIAAHHAVAPVGFWDRLAIVVLGLAGCALSYDALQQMAVAIHIRGLLTYLFPLVIDGFIAYGVRALLVLSEAPLRARLYVWVLFGTATAASIWANSLHAVRLNQQTVHTGLRLGDTVVAVLSTLAPLALAGAVHLYILITRHHPGAGHGSDQTEEVSREQTMHHSLASAPASDRTRPADHPEAPSGRRHGPTSQTGAESLDQSVAAGQGHQRTRDQTTETAPADHPGPATDQQTNPTSDQAADHDTAAADQQASVGPQGVEGGDRTRKTPGQEASGSHGPEEHDQADHRRESTHRLGPASAEKSAPTDQMPDQERPRTTDRSTESTIVEPDAPDHTDQPADRPADHSEDGSSGGPRGARSTDHTTSHAPRTKSADQNDEVPWEVKVEVARQAALEAGRMTRRVIRPHLRRHNITISNEGFRKLQAQLYADPALAHLPRTTRKR
ncbi:DUF2637 domain-containing protein [Streptomyces griseorubiginosus]|uniref:DUF2637 domain-containing protein n=1 Tax=Streptomyces griseorubiginosus TaxID=67304 RepID=UPI0036ABF2A3